MQISFKCSALFLLIWFCKIPLYSQVPLNWTIDEVNPGEDVTLFPDESDHTEGAKSCHLQLHSGAVPYLISDIFYITPGAEYEFSIDVLDNDTAGLVKVYADFYDTYGFNIFGAPPFFSADSGQWQTISWQGSIPEQAVVGYILVKFYCQPNLYSFTKTSDILIDNVQFRETGGDNMVANGGFEEWIVGIDEDIVQNDKLTIYPNPARDFVNVIVPEGFEYLVITDLLGHEVIKMQNNGQAVCKMAINHLPAGTYIILVYSQGKSPKSGLFCKL